MDTDMDMDTDIDMNMDMDMDMETYTSVRHLNVDFINLFDARNLMD